ncbi:MAG TPA: hypothetical protein PLW10_07950 [Myxococcota bacterium]|nr:hypothetical protein [Myxococcota bacterium]
MLDQWTNQLGGGRRAPDLRSPGSRSRTWVPLWVLGLLVAAAPSWAAEVVEVRVGRHPEFTRVVFELDRAAGYRIERSDASAGAPELIVSLEASSIPRRIRSQKTFIEQVEVEPSGRRAIAHIRLAKDDLRLKEMILANPPRIVLDLSSDAPVVAATRPTPTTTATKPAPTSTPTTSPTTSATTTANATKAMPTRDEAAFEDVVARAESEARDAANAKAEAAKQAAAEADRKAEEAAKAAAAEAERLAKKARKKAKAKAAALAAAAEAEAEKEAAALREAADRAAAASAALAESAAEKADAAGDAIAEAAESAGEAIDEAGTAMADAASEAVDGADVDAVLQGMAGGAKPTEGRADAGTGQAAKPAEARPTRPMVVTEDADEGPGIMTWGLAAIGAIVVLLGGFIALRRRGGVEVDFEAEDAPSLGGDDDMPVSASDANPFADLMGDGEQTIASGPGASTAGSLGRNTGGGATLLGDDEKESESVVFDDSEESKMDDMEVISRDQVNEALGSAMPAMGGIPEEFQQMMREMARRVEALEARCDELVDARDRLERQVAAQTEELRVQRAAIARTQRAVRNLARPGEGGEEEATEPALKEPN